MREFLEQWGRLWVQSVAELGHRSALFFESLYWLFIGPSRGQPVSLDTTAQHMMHHGVAAAPLVMLLSFGTGVILAIQGAHTLRNFGAEQQVVLGIALSVTREFGPLMVGMLLAGRTGSALAARIGTMVVNQEVDALRVMGINPVRYLVAPPLLSMLLMMPCLTVVADFSALFGGAFFAASNLDISYSAYAAESLRALSVDDVMQGIGKSVLFGLTIATVGAANGFMASGGAEGVGRATTRAVVQSIAGIVMVDMLFTFFLNR